MPIEFRCQGCGRHIRTREEHGGKKSKCPGCGQSLLIPSTSSPEFREAPAAGEAEGPGQASRVAREAWDLTKWAAGTAYDKVQARRQRKAAERATRKAEEDEEIETLEEVQPKEAEPPAAPPAAPPADAVKACPYCGETIRAVAVKCRFCGEFLGPRAGAAPAGARAPAGAMPGQPGRAAPQQRKEWTPPPYHEGVTWPTALLKWVAVLLVVLAVLFVAYHKEVPLSVKRFNELLSKDIEMIKGRLGVAGQPGPSQPAVQTQPASEQPKARRASQRRRRERSSRPETRQRTRGDVGELFQDIPSRRE